MPPEFEIVPGRGGSWTIAHVPSGERMHPLGDPLAEARALYLEPTHSLERAQTDTLHHTFWDVGLGMGANAMAWVLGMLELQERGLLPNPVELVSFEKDFSAFQMAVGHPEAFSFLAHPSARVFGSTKCFESKLVRWRLAEGDFFELSKKEAPASVIYYDPFSRSVNPDFWTVDAFAHLMNCATDGAILATYANARSVREAMALAGWRVTAGPGFGNRNQTTLATRTSIRH